MSAGLDAWLRKAIQEHDGPLRRFLRSRLYDQVAVPDLAQEAFLRLTCRAAREAEPIRNVRAYLYQIAKNLLDEWRVKNRYECLSAPLPRDDDEEALAAPDSADPVDPLLQARLEQVLSGLSSTCCAVVVLNRREGMTYSEIAQLLDISESMVKKYLTRGLAHCQAELQDLR